ncbi:MAG TPA: GNAT family N-acetyltransferase [Candidatus Dormibacteraeota bacterium]|jgi:RimJ/RimL family protein N-acetyltransferase|nr:GNAT family N-acetyltransferase [Candidatus Dormibacteraeota bacterium]
MQTTPGAAAGTCPRVVWQQRQPARRVAVLCDGRRILLRPLQPDDRELYLRGFEHLSSASRYMRFFSPKLRLSETEIRYFLDVDHHTHEAIAAIDVATGEAIGVARYVADRTEPDVAEVSITVVDSHQGLGLGAVLLEFVGERAAEEGIGRLRAMVLADNTRMLNLIRSRWPRHTLHRRQASVLELEWDVHDRAAAPERIRTRQIRS